MASNNNLFFKALSSLRSGCRGAAARGTRSLCSACLTHWRTDRIAGWAAAHRRLGTPPDSELHARGELDRARLADRSCLTKRGRRTRRIDAGAEVAVHRDDVRPIRQVEYFEQGFDLCASDGSKRSAQARIDAEEIGTRPRVPLDERAVDERTTGGPLNRRHAGCDVEWQGRVVLEHAAQLKAVRHALPRGSRRAGR